jgi:hypothetical protein
MLEQNEERDGEIAAELQAKIDAIETELRILKERHVSLNIAFVVFQFVFGGLLFLGCLYVILQPYFGLPMTHEPPTFTNVVAACVLVLAIFWIYRVQLSLKILLIERQRANDITIRARNAIDSARQALAAAELNRFVL